MKATEAERARLKSLPKKKGQREAARKTRERTVAQREAKNARQKERRAITEATQPTFTAAVASEFALLLAAGVSPVECLRYLSPAYFAHASAASRRTWLSEWSASPLLLTAINELNGGEWHKLDPDRRLQLALDKHLAELAHFLYTHSFRSASGEVLRKIDTAAARLTDFLTDRSGGDSPFKDFVQEFMAQWKADGGREVPVPLPPMGSA